MYGWPARCQLLCSTFSVPFIESSGIWAPGLGHPSASPCWERGFANGRWKCCSDYSFRSSCLSINTSPSFQPHTRGGSEMRTVLLRVTLPVATDTPESEDLSVNRRGPWCWLSASQEPKSLKFKQIWEGDTSGKEPACQCRGRKRLQFEPWVRKIPWRRAWQPTPVFLPGESHGQRSLAGYSP